MKSTRLKPFLAKPGLALFVFPPTLVLLGLFGGGCAGIMTQKFPHDTGAVQAVVIPANVSNETLHKSLDLPMGVYRIPKTNVFISNVQGDDELASTYFFFGVIGADIAGADIAGNSKKQIQDFEGRLGLDIPAMTQQSLAGAMAKGTPTNLTLSQEDTQLQINSALVLSSRGEKTARLWVVLKASLVDTGFNIVEWKCRYIAGLGKARPFEGKDGWNSMTAAAIQAEALKDTNEAVRVMMLDLAGGLKDEKAPQKEMIGSWVFYKTPQRETVRVYASTDQEDIVQPLVDDKDYFAGVNILPKDFAWTPDTP